MAQDSWWRRAARRGDRRAFERRLEPVAPVLHGVVYHVVGDRAVAREVLQEAVREAFTARRKLRRAASFRVWMAARVLDAARARARRLALDRRVGTADEGFGLLPDARRPARARRNPWVGALMGSGLAALPETTRALVYLRHEAGLAVRELAAILGDDAEAVSLRLAQARECLRRHRARAATRTVPHESGACRPARELWDLVRDGDLVPVRLARVRGHLRNCLACLEYQAQTRRLEEEVRGALRQGRITAGALRLLLARALGPGASRRAP